MGYLFLLLLIAAGFFVVTGYNRLRGLAEGVKEGWSNIAVVTRKKISLINQLVEVVKSYQDSEKLVMLKVSEDSVAAVQRATTQSGTVLAEIGRMAQRYPDLKVNQQYNMLIGSIQSAEHDVQTMRLSYNSRAKEYNTVRTTMPNVLFAGALGFGVAEYLTLDAVESESAGVQRTIINEDSERVNQLLGAGVNKAVSAAKSLGQQGKALADKGVQRLQQGGAAEQFSYLDASRTMCGPVSRADLERLYASGAINPETDVLNMALQSWHKYSTLVAGAAAGSVDGSPIGASIRASGSEAAESASPGTSL